MTNATRRWALSIAAITALMAAGCDDGSTPAEADSGAGGIGGMAGQGGEGGQGGMAGEGGAGGETGIGVSDPAARACEVLFSASPAAAVSVTFADAVTGTWRRREDRVAVSFFTRADGAIPAGALALSGVDPTPTTVRCYDRLGAILEGVELVLEQ